MSLTIELVRFKNGIKDSQKLRYQVYVNEEKVMKPNPFRRIFDEFDHRVGTITLNAYTVDRKCVGTVRLVPYSKERGIPYQKYFNFSRIEKYRKTKKANSQKIIVIGMLAIKHEYRVHYGLFSALIKHILSLMTSLKFDEALAMVNHKVSPALNGIGFQTIETIKLSTEISNTVEIMHVKTSDVHINFPEETLHSDLLKYVDSYKRMILLRGEKVVVQDTYGDEFFIIMNGIVGVYVNNKGECIKVGNCFKDPGEDGSMNMLLGEMAVLSRGNKGGVRTATGIVESRIAEVLVCPGKIFRINIFGSENPDINENLKCLVMSSLGEKLAGLNSKLSKISHVKDIGDRIKLFLAVFENKVSEAHLACLEEDFCKNEVFGFEWLSREIGVDYNEVKPFEKQLINAGVISLGRKKEIILIDSEKLAKFSFTLDLA